MSNWSFLFFLIIFITAFAISFASTKHLIPLLSAKAEQPIYDGGPSWHMSKAGTPTMGGIAFLITFVAIIPFGAIYVSNTLDTRATVSLWLIAAYALLNAMVGLFDDLIKLHRKKNGGLTPMQKILFQSVAAALFLFARYSLLGEETSITFGGIEIDLGLAYYPIAGVVLLGITNCANLTDGIDGLATSVAFAISSALFFISYSFSNEVAVISAITLGMCVGFLVFNINPAKIFMGDTGSLFLGSLLAAAAVGLGNPILMLALGIVYVLEGASVILQVITYKLSGKRLFLMAPLHHHLERLGFGENKICICAIILTLIASVAAFAIQL